MATATQQKKLKQLYEQSMASGGRNAFRANWEQSIGVHEVEISNGRTQKFDAQKRELDHNNWSVGEVMSSLCGPNWRNTFEQFWREASRARFEGVGGSITAGDTPYVSAGIDVIAGLMNARALARAADPEWIWDKMCNVQEATGEGGHHIGSRVRPDTQPFTDLADEQTLPTVKLTQTRIHRNRTLSQGLRAKANYWAIRDDLTGQIMESVDQTGVFVLEERERKVADAAMGVSTGTTLGTGVSIGVAGNAMPMVQDGLTFFPYQKGSYGDNANKATPAPENGIAVANYANCNDTDGQGLTDYTCIVRAMQVLLKNRDPFTGLPRRVDFNRMQFLVAPAAATQLKVLLSAQMLWQIANSGFNTSGGTATVGDYNLIKSHNLEIVESQFWFNRLVDAGVYKVAHDGTATHQALTNAVGDSYNTAGSIMSAFFMGHFRNALTYWQRMPYQVIQVPLSSVEYGEQTVIVQDHRERGQVFWNDAHEVWRAWA